VNPPSPAAAALAAVHAGDWDRAASIVAQLVREAFALEPRSVQISRDGYSLNSVNGFVEMAGGEQLFFKFHHEEGEEVTLEELYRGELLQQAGYPVDLPLYVSRQIGRQLLLYRRRRDPRFVEVCAGLEYAQPQELEPVLRAQRDLDHLTCTIYRRTLHAATAEQQAREPVHQLFHHRLVDREQPSKIGGRARRFFFDRNFDIAGFTISDVQLRAARWRINGVDYADSIQTLLERSATLLRPTSLAGFGGVTAHGDAHNANLWWEQGAAQAPRLVLFDPAFAGSHVSALLAEVKATFHNIFAHPHWLYSPARVRESLSVQAQLEGSTIKLTTDWQLTPLRRRFLDVKAEAVWRPLLKELALRRMLAADWRSTLRCALFCCPTLVMDLCAGGAGGHNPSSSALGLAIAVRCGSEPLGGAHDEVSDFLDRIAPPQD
jgi:hypothetical protein